MPRRIFQTPETRTDQAEISAFIAERSEQAAVRFFKAVEQGELQLLNNPELGTLAQLRSAVLEGIRIWPVPGYRNYLIFYRPWAAGIQVLRVIHAARDWDVLLQGDAEPSG